MTIRFGILTLSDRSSRGERDDSSGPALARLILAKNWSVTYQHLLPDDESAIRDLLVRLGVDIWRPAYTVLVPERIGLF